MSQAKDIVRALVYEDKAIATDNIQMKIEAEWAHDMARALLSEYELELLLFRTSGMEVKNIMKKLRLSPIQFKEAMDKILAKLDTEEDD